MFMKSKVLKVFLAFFQFKSSLKWCIYAGILPRLVDLFYFMNVVCSFVNYAIFQELCDRMRFEVDGAKSHHGAISEGL